MVHPLNIDLAIGAIRHGFDPWVCTVEVYGLERTLRFQVLDINGRPIVGVLRLSATDVIDPKKLRDVILWARTRIERKGFTLNAWNPVW